MEHESGDPEGYQHVAMSVNNMSIFAIRKTNRIVTVFGSRV